MVSTLITCWEFLARARRRHRRREDSVSAGIRDSASSVLKWDVTKILGFLTLASFLALPGAAQQKSNSESPSEKTAAAKKKTSKSSKKKKQHGTTLWNGATLSGGAKVQ